MFDAYTIKKVMPRLVAAAILIQLSWPLITQGINIVSQLSWGLEGLIYAPFGGREALDISKSLKVAGGNTSFSVILGGTVAWLAVGAPGMMALAIAVLFALLTAFITLIIRQILIIMLVLTAPLAIVAWILPNTEHLWKLWWSTLSKALLMYPIFLLLMATGRVAAHLAATASTGDNMPEAIGLVIVIVLYFLPFFLMAKAFQMAGGAIAATSNAISSRGSRYSGAANKRAFGKQSESFAKRKSDLLAGEYVKGRAIPKRYRPAVTNRLNNATRRVGTGVKGRFGFGAAGESATDTAVANRAAELMKTPEYAANSENDPILQGAAAGRTEAEAVVNLQRFFGYDETRAKQIAAQTRATIGFGAANQQAAAQQLVATGTGYSNYEQMKQVLANASGGNSSTASRLAGFANATTKKVGRGDLAPGFARLNADVHEAAGIQPRDVGHEQTGTAMTDESRTRVLQASRGAGDPTTLLRGKPAQVQELADALNWDIQRQAEVINNQTGEYTPEQIQAAQQELARSSHQVRELERGTRMGYASDDVSQIIGTLVNGSAHLLTVGQMPIPRDDETNLPPTE